MSGQPLPELVDFRVTPGHKKAILFIQQGEAFYRRHLDLTREGAELWAVNPDFGTAVFKRSNRRVKYDDVSAVAYDRYLDQKYIPVKISPEMAADLTRVFWPELEGVRAAPDLLNAAD